MFCGCLFSSSCLKATWEEARDFQEGLPVSTSQATCAVDAMKKMALQRRAGLCMHASVLNQKSSEQKQSTKEPGFPG